MHFRTLGIDLAASPLHPSGAAILSYTRDDETSYNDLYLFHCGEVSTDRQLVKLADKANLVCIDAPLTTNIPRECDAELRRLGAPPISVPGIRQLAIRGTSLKQKLGQKVIETSVKATETLLDIPHNRLARQKWLRNLNMGGEITKRFLTMNELDATICAYTALLNLLGKTTTPGNDVYLPVKHT